jgi:hypothetical protein
MIMKRIDLDLRFESSGFYNLKHLLVWVLRRVAVRPKLLNREGTSGSVWRLLG